MTKSVSATHVQKNFGRWADRALQEPVAIERHGRETLFMISADEYRRLKRLERQAMSAAEIDDDVARLIEAAEYGN